MILFNPFDSEVEVTPSEGLWVKFLVFDVTHWDIYVLVYKRVPEL